MYCDICRKYEGAGTFVTGCTNFKLESVKVHNSSLSHKQNVSKWEAKQARPGETQAEKTVLALNKHVLSKLVVLFKTAHALAKHGRPYSDFSWLCELDEAKGLSIGTMYRNDKRCQEFVNAIASKERYDISCEVSTVRFISVICDGATDSFHREAEVCYLRACHMGTVSTKFIGIKNIPKADADGIVHAVSKLLSSCLGNEDMWKQKLVAFGSDGASVMVGKKGGVVKKFKDDNRPFLLGVHCSAHRLELAYKDACKEVPLYKKVDALMTNLYYFYRNSSLNRSNLIASFDALGKKPLMPTRVSGTRWLPHTQRAVRNIVDGYEAIVNHLQQLQNPQDLASKKESAAKAKNFLKVLLSRDAVYFVFFLWDVATCLSTLSLAFQDRMTTVGEIHSELNCTKAILESYKARFTTLADVTWAQVNNALSEKCPNVLGLIDLILAIPASSAEAERGFSLMKSTKTDWRSTLKDTSLSDLMMVQLMSPPISEFDPHEAINFWLNDKHRRPQTRSQSIKDIPVPIISVYADADADADERPNTEVVDSLAVADPKKDYHSDEDSGAEEGFYSDSESESEDIDYRQNHAMKAYALFQSITLQ
ncbi:zinc finger protein 862-like [Ptychodera flava]|uniref:zinc finger protein 862-like n=1 Tax=Ptychodera flava TaxID=63121 RepID=UPI00396A71CF